MENLEFGLSINNLRDIPFYKYANDFTFHVNDKTYKTSRFVADLLSPYIRHLHYSDESIDEYTLEVKPSNEDSFEQFLKLASFEKTKINKKQQKQFAEYFRLLGNTEDFFNIQPEYCSALTENNAIEKLNILTNLYHESISQISIENNDSIIKIIEFISMHFDDFDKEKMAHLNLSILDRIINNDKIKLHDEDSLLMFVLSLYEKDKRAAPLFEYVIFSNVSEESISTFIDKFDVEDINNGVWRSICGRMCKSKQVATETAGRYKDEKILNKTIELKYEEGKELNGIMRHLTNQTGGNINDNGTIEISSNSIYLDNHPKNLVDYQNEKNRYRSLADGKAFIRFNFKNKAINLTTYQIKSNLNSDGSFNPKNWAIDVSNDGENWEEIDRRQNDLTLKRQSYVGTFEVQKQNKEFYQYVRFRQTGESTYQNDMRFWFCFIEFYGQLKEIK